MSRVWLYLLVTIYGLAIGLLILLANLLSSVVGTVVTASLG